MASRLLRYFATVLSGRLAEVEYRLSSPQDEAELKRWFKTIKKRDSQRADRRIRCLVLP
jgi:hypothetical protein